MIHSYSPLPHNRDDWGGSSFVARPLARSAWRLLSYRQKERDTFRRRCLRVRRMRLELTRSCDHYPLKVACIPISPPARRVSDAPSKSVVPRTGLEPAHLAACAPETHASTNSAIWAYTHKVQKKRAENETRTRDPDLGKVVLYQLSYFRIFL